VFFEEWDDPLISGIGWVSELVEIADGIDIFADRAAHGFRMRAPMANTTKTGTLPNIHHIDKVYSCIGWASNSSAGRTRTRPVEHQGLDLDTIGTIVSVCKNRVKKGKSVCTPR
jgi:hypothetical protein